MDFNLLAGATRGPARAAAGAEPVRGARVALSLQALLPVIEAHGARTQFARDLRALVADAARGLGAVFVVQPAGSSQVRIEVGRQFLAVPPTLRDAVLALSQDVSRGVRESASPATATSAAAPAAASATAPMTAGAIAWAQSWAASVHSGAGAAVATALAAPKTLRFAAGESASSRAVVDADVVLLDDPSIGSAAAATRLRSAIETSGLFFESHLAAWSAGARSAEDIRAELARMQRSAAHAHEDDSAGARIYAAASGERVAAQLEVMQKSAFALNAVAWPGQPCTIEFRKDAPDRHAPAAAAGDAGAVVSATLKLELPHFGPLEVRLRLAGMSVAVTAAARPQSRAQLAASLDQLGHALQARGLNPAALRMSEPA